MKKGLLIVGISLFLFAGSALVTQASANICNDSPNGYHIYNDHRLNSAGYTVPNGQCTYISGYDEKLNPIYKSDCYTEKMYQYCERICCYCKGTEPNSTHSEYRGLRHSVLHN